MESFPPVRPEPGPRETYCRACGAIVVVAAAYCMNCSISDPGIPDLNRLNDESRRSRTDKRLPVVLAAFVVAAGSMLGIPAIFLSGTSAGIIAVWISAPVIEELFKPFGVYLLLAFWPATVNKQPSIAALCGLSGLTFGLVESALYVFVYFPDGGENYAQVRFTLPVAMHVAASTIFGFGVNRPAFAALGRGDLPDKRSWGFILAAMCLHATYNIVVTVIEFV